MCLFSRHQVGIPAELLLLWIIGSTTEDPVTIVCSTRLSAPIDQLSWATSLHACGDQLLKHRQGFTLFLREKDLCLQVLNTQSSMLQVRLDASIDAISNEDRSSKV